MANAAINMPLTEDKFVTSLFTDRTAALCAFDFAQLQGYSKDDVSVVMSEETRKQHFERTDLADRALEGAGVGSAIGGTAGAIIAALVAVAAPIVIPGVGLVIAGPIAAALAGAGAGGLAGGLIGGLVGAGIPEERAKLYEQGVKSGGIVLGIHPRTEQDAVAIEREWRRLGGQHIHR